MEENQSNSTCKKWFWKRIDSQYSCRKSLFTLQSYEMLLQNNIKLTLLFFYFFVRCSRIIQKKNIQKNLLSGKVVKTIFEAYRFEWRHIVVIFGNRTQGKLAPKVSE
jgi:hypothetical protein